MSWHDDVTGSMGPGGWLFAEGRFYHLRELLITMQRVTQIREPHLDMRLRSVVDGLVNHTGGAFSRERLTALVDDLYTANVRRSEDQNVRSGSRGSRRAHPRSRRADPGR